MIEALLQLDKKIKLEQIYRREVKRLFGKMLLDYRVHLAATGLPIDATHFKSQWHTLTVNHIRRVQKSFKGVATAGKIKVKAEDDDKKKEILALALLTFMNKEAEKQADLITATNAKDQNTALSLARLSKHSDGTPIAVTTNREIALLASSILTKRYQARTQSIIMSQTQSASESSKFAEAEVESGQTPRILKPTAFVTSTTRKIWQTMGDKRVRDIHKKANGQRVMLNNPFIVNGQRLMHPGDDSMGASADNIINCRCVAIYSF